jgi:TPP-dependent pyruvate/acetoin dehydrogenase alpha subunit
MLSTDTLLKMLDKMLLIRHFDETAYELYYNKEVAGGTHQMTTLPALTAVTVTVWRRAEDPKRMMAELMGKRDGYCKGKGGSMHIADVGAGNLGASGIVAGSMPIAVGAGLSSQLKKDGRMTLCFFGDGAANTGAAHEAMNLAAVWKLPVVFVCENNLYGISVPVREASVVDDFSKRASGYGMPGASVDGNKAWVVYEGVGEAVQRARDGKGPSLIQCLTHRWKGHAASDACVYRTKEELAAWKEKCPIKQLKEKLFHDGVLDEAAFQEREAKSRAIIAEAVEFGRNSPYPSSEAVNEDLFAPSFLVTKPEPKRGERKIPYWQALNEAIQEEMTRNDGVVLFGEDMCEFGGVFGMTRELWKRFPGRVRNTPISEDAIAGTAVGAACPLPATK